jgi:hypothetical protein
MVGSTHEEVAHQMDGPRLLSLDVSAYLLDSIKHSPDPDGMKRLPAFSAPLEAATSGVPAKDQSPPEVARETVSRIGGPVENGLSQTDQIANAGSIGGFFGAVVLGFFQSPALELRTGLRGISSGFVTALSAAALDNEITKHTSNPILKKTFEYEMKESVVLGVATAFCVGSKVGMGKTAAVAGAVWTAEHAETYLNAKYHYHERILNAARRGF